MNKDCEIKCDVCDGVFTPSQIVIEKEILDVKKMVVLRYYNCPLCGHRYIIEVTDTYVRNDIVQYKKLMRKQERLIAKRQGSIKVTNNMVKMEALRQKIQHNQAELMRKWC